MGTLLAKEGVERANKQLNDKDYKRWSMDELLDYFNDGQRAVVLLRPDANVITTSLQLITGTRQSLPTDGLRLVSVMRNMGLNGNTPGRPIRIVDREELDLLKPDWHSGSPNVVVKAYVYDGRVPKVFYVEPSQPATPHQAEISYQANPVNSTITGVGGGGSNSVMTLDDIYFEAHVDYILYRAWGKDSEFKNVPKSQTYYQKFLNSLGLKVEVDRAFDPHRNAPPQEPRTGEQRDTAF